MYTKHKLLLEETLDNFLNQILADDSMQYDLWVSPSLYQYLADIVETSFDSIIDAQDYLASEGILLNEMGRI